MIPAKKNIEPLLEHLRDELGCARVAVLADDGGGSYDLVLEWPKTPGHTGVGTSVATAVLPDERTAAAPTNVGNGTHAANAMSAMDAASIASTQDTPSPAADLLGSRDPAASRAPSPAGVAGSGTPGDDGIDAQGAPSPAADLPGSPVAPHHDHAGYFGVPTGIDDHATVWEQDGVELYSGARFFRHGDAWLARHAQQPAVMIAVDINFFRLYNDIFGRESGNRFLDDVAASLTALARERDGIGGHMGGDDFCLLLPTKATTYDDLREPVERVLERLPFPDGFMPILGVYLACDRSEDAAVLYDRALAAVGEIKGSYTERYRFYDAGHFSSERRNKLLTIEAREGLERGEFCFYLQPQVNERNGLIVGAEALVRWVRAGQVVEPSVFIEELEKNGFIYELDRTVWEQVCAWLADAAARGLEPVPVSVNVSRMDFYFADVAEELIGLVDRYGVDPALLGVEITETSFTDDLDVIRSVTERLHARGFRVYMDDFGSGYSSLSMLYQLDVDGIKTDVGFLSRLTTDEKAASIVESVISMAHMIGVMVITEGVETQAQRDLLVSMGDTYVQGFYFYRPMPVAQFEELLAAREKVGVPPQKTGILMTSRLHFKDMMTEGILSDTLLDNIVGPAAVYREEDGVISIIQMNEAYSRLTGIGPQSHADMERFIRHHYGENAGVVREAFHHADHSLEGSYSEAEFHRDDGSSIMLRGRIFLLYTYGNHRLYMSTILAQ